jgi:hypothetical protein
MSKVTKNDGHVTVAADAVRLTGRCAGCNKPFSVYRPAVGGGVLVEVQGTAAYHLCGRCAECWRSDNKFRQRLEREAFRTIFGAGPDQVGGVA